jgi:uncharacterized membrane protein
MLRKFFGETKEKEKFPDCRLACFLVVLFIVVFVFLSFSRHAALKSYLNDLGTYDQVVWNTTHGHFFDNSANMLGNRNYLGAHFSPILLLFVPFYAIVASPKWLLFFQVVAAGGSAIFIYQFAREKLKKAYLGIVFLLSYLLNPYFHNGLLYDFHEVVFAVFFAAGAFFFLEKRNNKLFILFSALLALSQEHMALLVFMMGVYAFVAQKRYKFGLTAAAAALSYFLLVMLALIPHFSATGNPSLIANNSLYPLRYRWMGKSLGEMAKNMFFHPFEIAKIVLNGERLNYLYALIVPVFSLAVFAWPVIIVIPIILINLLSSLPLTYSVFFYYSAVIMPFIYFSAIITFKRWFSGNRPFEKMFAVFVSVCSAFVFFTGSLVPGASNMTWQDFLPSANAKKIEAIKNILPADASISVQHNLGPHFSERREVNRFPLKTEESDFVVLDRFDPYEKSQFKFFDFDYALQMDQREWQNKIDELKASPDFKVFFDDGEYLIFENMKKK